MRVIRSGLSFEIELLVAKLEAIFVDEFDLGSALIIVNSCSKRFLLNFDEEVSAFVYEPLIVEVYPL